MSINKVIISGNVTRDPELRATASGMPVLSFGLAVNDRHKNQQTGEWEDYPNFVDCTMFGKRAESIARYIAKGSKLCIDGKLRYTSWEKDGQKRTKLEVVAEDVELMSQRQGAQQAAAPQYAPQAAQYAAPQFVPVQQQTQYVEANYYTDDIPF